MIGLVLILWISDHQVEFFKDQQHPNGDVSTVIRMKVALNDTYSGPWSANNSSLK